MRPRSGEWGSRFCCRALQRPTTKSGGPLVLGAMGAARIIGRQSECNHGPARGRVRFRRPAGSTPSWILDLRRDVSPAPHCERIVTRMG